MPLKSRKQREKTAKAEGIPLTERYADLGESKGAKPHAAKKSRGVARLRGFPDRHVSSKAVPGEAVSKRRSLPETPSRRKNVPAPAAAAYRKSGRHKQTMPEVHERPAATVKGRKKVPSQMHVRRKGGPRKRSPLHGG